MPKELESWTEEKRSAYLYRTLAAIEEEPARQRLFSSLAEAAEKQADLWKSVAGRKGSIVPESFHPDVRTRLVASLINTMGPERIKPVLAAMKVRGLSVYSPSRHSTHEMPTATTPPENLHRTAMAGGNLRAAIFGANDGLVSNVSLILGITGATSDHSVVVLSGVAGMLAGAFSMAAGEYISVRSQRELLEYQIALEKEELDEYPAEEAMELALIYEAKGLKAEDAKRLAERIISDPSLALDTLTREELGLNPEDLGSPWGAAGFSFLSFSTGAILPLLPFLLRLAAEPLKISLTVAGVALFGLGAATSLFTGRSAFWGGARMFLIGGAAGTATFLIGRWLGVALS